MPNSPLTEGTRAWRNGRAAAGALGLLSAGIYLFEGRGLRMGTMDAPGPGVFPLVVGILFAFVSLSVVADALLTREAGTASFPTGPSLRRVLVVFVAFIAYILLLDVLGFPLSTALFVAFYCRAVGRVSPMWSLVAGIGVAAAVWLVFGFLLEVRLPEAIWS